MSLKTVPPLNHLSFARLWEVYTSDRLTFDDVIDVKKRSVSVVEFRNALTAFRNAALDPSLHNSRPDYVMEQCASRPGCTVFSCQQESCCCLCSSTVHAVRSLVSLHSMIYSALPHNRLLEQLWDLLHMAACANAASLAWHRAA
jgi:hypothetical protein